MIDILEYKLRVALIDADVNNQLSTAVDMEGMTHFGLVVPILNNTPNITFKVSHDGDDDSTFVDLKQDDGSTAAITVVGGVAAIAIGSADLAHLAGWRFIKVYASVAQSADRTFYFVGKA